MFSFRRLHLQIISDKKFTCLPAQTNHLMHSHSLALSLSRQCAEGYKEQAVVYSCLIQHACVSEPQRRHQSRWGVKTNKCESSGRWDADPFGILDPTRDDDAKREKQLSLST